MPNGRLTIYDIFSQLFGNSRFYSLAFLIGCLISVTILGLFRDLSSYAITAIIAGLVGAGLGHANGALQGYQEAKREAQLAQQSKDKTQG